MHSTTSLDYQGHGQALNSQFFNTYQHLINVLLKRAFVKIPTRKGYIMLNENDIIRIETHSYYVKNQGWEVQNGDGNATHIYTVSGEKYMITRQIAEWKKVLPTDTSFLQVHQSHLVNTFYISQFCDEDGLFVKMINGDNVPVSSKYKSALLKILNRSGEKN